VFSFHFFPKFFRFWSIILQNGTKHHAEFLAKVVIIHFGFWSQGVKKSQNEPQEAS
jgi:hypothetical protein